MQPTFDLTSARELDARSNDGVEVRLLWHPPTDGVAVEVIDGRREERFAFAIETADACDAFHHPFAYAAREALVWTSVVEPAAELEPTSLSLHTQ